MIYQQYKKSYEECEKDQDYINKKQKNQARTQQIQNQVEEIDQKI